MKTKTAVLAFVFFAGLLLGVAPLAQANTYVTFQVDMTYQVNAGTFTNGVSQVAARGSFNDWGNGTGANAPFVLTNNPSGANPNLYTGTYYDTADTNGGQIQWKFWANNSLGYETTENYNDNRITLLPTTNDASLVLPWAYFSDAAYTQNPVANNATFRVDMAQQIALGNFDPNSDTVEAQGDFNNWKPGSTLTWDPSILRTNQFGLVSSNVYVGTFPIGGSPGQIEEFQYVIQPAGIYESPNLLNGYPGNHLGVHRFCFVLDNFSSSQTLPIVFFSDQPYAPVATNNVVFSVDMSSLAFLGAVSNQVTLAGDFNNWGSSYTVVCTNNPNAGNTNIYTATIAITNGVGATMQFKFLNGSTFENNPSHTYSGNPSVIVAGQNRGFTMPNVNNSTVVLPAVYWNDYSPSSVLPTPTAVTFNVNMTGATGTDAHVFNPSTDKVYMNGLDTTNSPGNYSWEPWIANPGPTNAISNFLMTENPVGSSNYTITLTIPAGYPVQLTYKYSINGNDDEAGYDVNHVRYIRSTDSYTMPTDIFGYMYHEQSFGNLAIGPQFGGNVPITWLGRPGVNLQVSTNLASGAWVNLPATDAQSSTNYPAGANASYFRLVNPF